MELFTNQTLAAEKVLEEMKNAEEILKSWNLSWSEKLSDVYCPELTDLFFSFPAKELVGRYFYRYDLSLAINGKKIGVPLAKKKVLLNRYGREEADSFACEFGKIDWYDINSRRATRNITFSNSGDISIEKRNTSTSKKRRDVSYKSSFNVLNENDFELNGTILKNGKSDGFTFSLKKNILIEKFHGVEIIRDLETGKKKIRIENNNVKIEVNLNSENSLESGKVDIITHKGNGNVNGVYRFSLDNEVHALFYSRKGQKVNLTENPLALYNAYNLLSSKLSDDNIGNTIIKYFVDAIHTAIDEHFPVQNITFAVDLYSLGMVEDELKNLINDIRGEIPISGLADRIENGLYLVFDYNKDDYDKYLIKR